MLKYPEISKERLKSIISPYKKVFKGININFYKFKQLNLDKYKKFFSFSFKKNIENKKEDKNVLNNFIENKGLDKDLTKKRYSGNNLIKINSVTKSFGKNNVIDNISLNVPKQKITGIIGISGSGKTTLLKLIVGFYKPTKGSIALEGKDTLKYNKELRRNFGFGSQENCFYGKLNSVENIRYFGKLYGLTDSYINSRVDNVLKLVGLYDSRKTLADELSTGMRRRLDLACSLIHDPNILILDEPTEDLDPNLRREVIHLIKTINKQGKTVIITSHLLGEIENICDLVGIISNGKLIKFDTPEKLKEEYTKDFEIHLETKSKNYDSLIKTLKIKKFAKK